MNKAKEIPIPKTKIEEGIGISLKKSLEHLDGAEALIGKNLLNDAVALIEFAIEEFGRAVYLRERLQLGLETIELSLQKGPKAHDLKYEKAFSVLPKNLMTIWEQTYGINNIGMAYLMAGFGGVYSGVNYPQRVRKETISPSVRCDAVFTKFDEKTKKWYYDIRANSRKLKLVVDKLRENIASFKF